MVVFDIIITTINHEIGEPMVLLDEDRIIEYPVNLDKNQPWDQVSLLTAKHIKINPQYVRPSLCDNYIQDEKYHSVYSVLVPHQCEVKNGTWKTMEEVQKLNEFTQFLIKTGLSTVK